MVKRRIRVCLGVRRFCQDSDFAGCCLGKALSLATRLLVGGPIAPTVMRATKIHNWVLQTSNKMALDV